MISNGDFMDLSGINFTNVVPNVLAGRYAEVVNLAAEQASDDNKFDVFVKIFSILSIELTETQREKAINGVWLRSHEDTRIPNNVTQKIFPLEITMNDGSKTRVSSVLKDNALRGLDAVLEQGEKIEELVKRTEELSKQSEKFKRSAKTSENNRRRADQRKQIITPFLYSFAVSFGVSLLVSRGNPIAALQSGALSTLAVIINIFSCKVFTLICKKYKINPPQIANHSAYVLSIGSSLFLGHQMGMLINLKATFFASVIFYIWDVLETKKLPVMGTIVG